MSIRILSSALIGAVSLTACGMETPEELFVSQNDLGYKMQERIALKSGTEWDQMPTSGTARFDGYSLLRLNHGPDETEVYGVAVVNVDFTASTVDGVIDNFVGQNGDDEVDLYSGSITLFDGGIGDINPNDVYANFEGELEGHGTIVRAEGLVGGRFVGTPIEGIRMATESGTFSVDGAPVTGTLLVLGEN